MVAKARDRRRRSRSKKLVLKKQEKINRQEKISRLRGGVAPKKMVGVMIGQAQEKTRARIEHETSKAQKGSSIDQD